MLLVILIWFCWNAGIAPLWLAIVGTVLESIKIVCQVIAAILKAIEKRI